MGKHSIDVNDEQFAETTASGLTLVDFWAPWCGSCRSQGPILEEVAAEVVGQAIIAKINVEEHRGNASRLGVNGIPTLILFKDGQVVKKFVGLQSKQTLLSALRST